MMALPAMRSACFTLQQALLWRHAKLYPKQPVQCTLHVKPSCAVRAYAGHMHIVEQSCFLHWMRQSHSQAEETWHSTYVKCLCFQMVDRSLYLSKAYTEVILGAPDLIVLSIGLPDGVACRALPECIWRPARPVQAPFAICVKQPAPCARLESTSPCRVQDLGLFILPQALVVLTPVHSSKRMQITLQGLSCRHLVCHLSYTLPS